MVFIFFRMSCIRKMQAVTENSATFPFNYFNLRLCHWLLLRSLRAMTSVRLAWPPEPEPAWIKWEYRGDGKRVVTFIEQCGRSLAGSLVLPYVSVTLPGWLPGFLSTVRQIQRSIQSIHQAQPSAAIVLLFLEKHLTYLTFSTGQALKENISFR